MLSYIPCQNTRNVFQRPISNVHSHLIFLHLLRENKLFKKKLAPPNLFPHKRWLVTRCRFVAYRRLMNALANCTHTPLSAACIAYNMVIISSWMVLWNSPSNPFSPAVLRLYCCILSVSVIVLSILILLKSDLIIAASPESHPLE